MVNFPHNSKVTGNARAVKTAPLLCHRGSTSGVSERLRSIGRINALFTQVQQLLPAVVSPGNGVMPPRIRHRCDLILPRAEGGSPHPFDRQCSSTLTPGPLIHTCLCNRKVDGRTCMNFSRIKARHVEIVRAHQQTHFCATEYDTVYRIRMPRRGNRQGQSVPGSIRTV